MKVLQKFSSVPAEIGHTNNNRFLIVDFRDRDDFPSTVELQHLGFNACTVYNCDDLLVIENSRQADVKVRVIGKDCREAEYCGNGMLYVATKIGDESGKNSLTIETFSGFRHAVKTGGHWSVESGNPKNLSYSIKNQNIPPARKELIKTLVHVGEPHLIVQAPHLFTREVSCHEFNQFCFPFCEAFGYPGGVNVTMFFPRDEASVWIRTFERGVRRQTASCGTGAVAIASFLATPENPEIVTVFSPGGYHTVFNNGTSWYIQASAHTIHRGELYSVGNNAPAHCNSQSLAMAVIT